MAAVVDANTGAVRMRENFSYDESDRSVKISTEGTCRAVYGVEQVKPWFYSISTLCCRKVF